MGGGGVMLFGTRPLGYDRDDIISNMLVTSIKQRSDKNFAFTSNAFPCNAPTQSYCKYHTHVTTYPDIQYDS